MSQLRTKTKVHLLPYLLILPTLLFVILFTIYPTISSIVGSFFQQRLNIPRYRDPVFYGIGNYTDLLGSAGFRMILGNTLRYVAAVVPTTLVAALGFALWLSHKRHARFRIAIFHPTILPMVSAAKSLRTKGLQGPTRSSRMWPRRLMRASSASATISTVTASTTSP